MYIQIILNQHTSRQIASITTSQDSQLIYVLKPFSAIIKRYRALTVISLIKMNK